MASRGGYLWRGMLLTLLALSLLTGCVVTKGIRRFNLQYHSRQEVEEIKNALSQQAPTLVTPKILYLYDEGGSYLAPLQELWQRLDPASPLAREMALLMGDGSLLLANATDTLQHLNAHLLMGNSVEAARLLSLTQQPHLPSRAIVALSEGDTLTCIQLLKKLVAQGDKELGYRAARLWHQLRSQDAVPLQYLQEHSPSSWERFTAAAQLSSPRAETEEELAYLDYLEALESPDSLHLKEASHRLLALSPSAWREQALLRLRPLLYRHALWVEALSAHQSLPEAYQADYPYSLLTAYSDEIEWLRRYEMPPSSSPAPAPHVEVTPRDDSFRSRWGNVKNIDNWVMGQAMGFERDADTRSLLTPEEYRVLRHHLSSVLPHSEDD